MIFIVTAEADTPISFRSGRSTTETTTLSYIPGTALLGGLAQAHTLLRRNPDQFTQFFLKSTRFDNLYPASFAHAPKEKRSSLEDDDQPVYPLPTTARSCKRFSGFRFDAKTEGDHHGVFDQLIAWSIFELSDCANIHWLEQHKTCSYQIDHQHLCGETIDRLEGFYRRGLRSEQMGQPKNKVVLRTRTGINRATGAVEQEILYSRSALAEKSCFWGTIQIQDEIAEEFQSFVEEAKERGLIRVGNNRTRGFGKLSVLDLDEVNQDIEAELADLAVHLEQFNQHLHSAAQSVGVATPHQYYVPITLTADAILVDHLLRSQTTLTPTYLAIAHKLEGAELIYSNANIHRLMGWSNLHRLPKADEIAINMGSVFLFGFHKPADETFLRNLHRLQQEGIGIRRGEGFGQLMIASPFHWEVNNL